MTPTHPDQASPARTETTRIPEDATPPFLGLRWGIKASFLGYIARMPDGKGSATDGAVPVEGNEVVYEVAPIAPSTATRPDERVLAFRGDVRFSAHYGMLFVRIADPVVRILGSTAVMSVIDSFTPGARLDLVSFDIERRPAPEAYELYWGTGVRLLPTGTPVFGDVYEPGEAFDNLTIIVPRTD